MDCLVWENCTYIMCWRGKKVECTEEAGLYKQTGLGTEILHDKIVWVCFFSPSSWTFSSRDIFVMIKFQYYEHDEDDTRLILQCVSYFGTILCVYESIGI